MSGNLARSSKMKRRKKVPRSGGQGAIVHMLGKVLLCLRWALVLGGLGFVISGWQKSGRDG